MLVFSRRHRHPFEPSLAMSQTPVKRKLAAILAADVAGYSRMMGADEEGTLRTLAAHRTVIDGIIELHDGRVVSTAGDSVLAEFASPVEAVRCAVEVQDGLKTRNAALPEDKRMLFRIGVNLGDVMVRDNDLLGDGVNIAARLEGIAEPGGICISSSVYDQIAGKLDMGFVDIGEQSLKNIARPVRAFRVTSSAAAAIAAAPAKAGAAAWRRPLIAAVAVVLVAAAGAAAWYATRPKPADPPRDSTAAATAPARPPQPGSETGFDGVWRGEWGCAAYRDLAAFRSAQVAQVQNGEMTMQIGAAGQKGSWRFSGRVKDKDSFVLDGSGVPSGSTTGSVNGASMVGRFEGGTFTGDALLSGVRPCTFTAARAEIAARPQMAALPPAVPATSPFDGRWGGDYECEATTALAAIHVTRNATIKNGEMIIESGNPQGGVYFYARGQIAIDGNVELDGWGFNPQTARPRNTVQLNGRFDGNAFTGTGHVNGTRPCRIKLTRTGN
jgi:class 3 adenylate cyclase